MYCILDKRLRMLLCGDYVKKIGRWVVDISNYASQAENLLPRYLSVFEFIAYLRKL